MAEGEASESRPTPRHLGRVWCFFFGCMLLINGRYVFEPAYWDMLVGFFAEAHWLAENDLDCLELLYQPGYGEGGPNVYSPAGLPTAMAYGSLYYIGMPVRWVNATWHIVIWLCGATALTAVFRMARVHWDTLVSLLAAITLLSCPLFLSQTATFNLEAPLTATAILAFWCCVSRKYKSAVLLSTLAYNLHARGVIVLLATGAISLVDLAINLWYRYRSDKHGGREPVWRNGAFVSVLLHTLSAAVFAAYLLMREQVSPTPSGTFSGTFSGAKILTGVHTLNLMTAVASVPEVAAVAAIFLARVTLLFLQRWLTAARADEDTPGKRIIHEWACLHAGFLFRCGAFLSVYIAFMASFPMVLPRYHLMIYPVLLVGSLSLLAAVKVDRPVVIALLLIAVTCNIINYEGRLYGFQPNTNDGYILERSAEYRNDLHLNQRLAKKIESDFDLGRTVFVTSWPITQILSIPEAGYVSTESVEVVSLLPISYASVGALSEIYRVDTDGRSIEQTTDRDVIWVESRNCFYPEAFAFSASEGHELLCEMNEGKNKVVLYRRPKQFSNEVVARAISGSPRLGASE